MPSEPPRRDPSRTDSPRTEPGRRGGARREPDEPIPLRREGGRSRISDARGYTPRGRTVREAATGATRDSLRPALELVRDEGAGTRRGQARAGRGEPTETTAPSSGTARGADRNRGGTGGRTAARSTAGGNRVGAADRDNLRTGGGTSRTPAARETPRGTTPRDSSRSAAGREPARGGSGQRRGTAARAGGRPIRGGQPGRGGQPKLRRVVRRRPPRLGEPVRRLRLGAVFVMVLITVLAGRLVMLQMTDASKIARTGLEDRLSTQVLFAPRGTIYDSGRNVLAQSVEARYVFADPSMIKAEHLDQTVIALRDLLGVPASDLLPKLTRTKHPDGSVDMFEYLKRGVSIADADKVSALNIQGIGVGRDEIRVQPGNDLAANLIGYIGDDGLGKQGLEVSEDGLLAGVDGLRTYEVGNGDLGTQIPGGYEEVKAAHPGSSIELTIDRDVQYMAQQILYQQMTKVNATWACVVVMDTQTGNIRAQASYPTYSAANPDGSTAAQQADNCTQTVADPGSVHKVVTLGALLQTGTINAGSTIGVCPTETKGGTTYTDTHYFPCGTKLTIPGVLAFSSNIGTMNFAAQLGDNEAQTIYDYQRLYGLGQKTNEGMPNEAPGLLQKPDAWSGSSFGSVPIGLGVSATPLQMAAVYNTIANNGVYVAPRLLQSTIGPDGKETACPPAATHTVLSPANAQLLRTDLEAVVTVPHATGLSAAITGYRVAGKTGTGQFVGPNGKYATGTVASFIGMAPADAPRFTIAVFAYTPGGDEGGKAAAPAFRDLMAFVLGHYHVPPTGTKAPTFVTTG